jgi:hypothetical protein
MKCPECRVEMSKKWNPQTAVRVAPGSAVVWECSVCGHQLTQAEMKLASKGRQKPVAELNTVTAEPNVGESPSTAQAPGAARPSIFKTW